MSTFENVIRILGRSLLDYEETRFTEHAQEAKDSIALLEAAGKLTAEDRKMIVDAIDEGVCLGPNRNRICDFVHALPDEARP